MRLFDHTVSTVETRIELDGQDYPTDVLSGMLIRLNRLGKPVLLHRSSPEEAFLTPVLLRLKVLYKVGENTYSAGPHYDTFLAEFNAALTQHQLQKQ